jgi:hypothetical protein
VLFVAAALLLAVALALAGCSARCRPGTALVTVLLDGTAADADALVVTAQLAGASLMSQRFDWHGDGSGTLELRFPSGYPAGGRVDVGVSAQKGGAVVGNGSAVATLPDGCASFDLRVDPVAASDGGSPADAATVDAGGDPCAHLDDGTAVPGGQYLDRCCRGASVRLNLDNNCGGCGIQCRNGFHCVNTGATDARMWWCACAGAGDCWSNCCGTGNDPNTAAKVCSPSSCGSTAVCQGCPLGSTCEMTDPHYYCHY